MVMATGDVKTSGFQLYQASLCDLFHSEQTNVAFDLCFFMYLHTNW